MAFGKWRDKRTALSESTELPGEEIVEAAKTTHGRFTIVPRAKQLVNGNWIARITLEEETSTGSRSYDYAGPMEEFPSRDDAVRGGIEHAKRRLDEAL